MNQQNRNQMERLIKEAEAQGDTIIYQIVPCGYYRVRVNGVFLGDWGDYGMLSLLSNLKIDFWRKNHGLAPIGTYQEPKVERPIEAFPPLPNWDSCSLESLGYLTEQLRDQFKNWCEFMLKRMSPADNGILELICENNSYSDIMAWGNAILPQFNHCLVQYYSHIEPDIRVRMEYEKRGAAFIPLEAVNFYLMKDGNLKPNEIKAGQIVRFDSHKPYAIGKSQAPRWIIWFFQ